MSIRYVVENCDRFGRTAEVFVVLEFYDIFGARTNDRTQAVACVANDGTCHHTFDIDLIPVWTVH